jgi:hypothetical protein
VREDACQRGVREHAHAVLAAGALLYRHLRASLDFVRCLAVQSQIREVWEIRCVDQRVFINHDSHLHPGILIFVGPKRQKLDLSWTLI